MKWSSKWSHALAANLQQVVICCFAPIHAWSAPLKLFGTPRAGQLPALEINTDISQAADSEFAAARAVIAFAKKHLKDLDSHLSPSQRAELLAFSSLVESRLDLASTYSTWFESKGFAELKKVWIVLHGCRDSPLAHHMV